MSSTIERFLHTGATFLHWSYLDSHWDEHKEEPNSHTWVRLNLAYVAGMVGHALCAVLKVIQCVSFIFVTIGIGFQMFYYRLRELITDPHPSAVFTKNKQIKKHQLYESLLVTAGSLCALGVDILGTLCPPAAYKCHAFLNDEVVLKALVNIGIIGYQDKKAFTFSKQMAEIL